MKILLGDFSAKIGTEDISKLTTCNKSLHEIINDAGVRVVNFAMSKNLIVKNTVFPHCSIHKCTWTWPDWKAHNWIDHVLIDKRQYLNIFVALSSRGADCETDQYLVVAKIRQKLLVSKVAEQKFDMKKFTVQRLYYVEVKESGLLCV
jgi:hypothetical protein